MVKLKEIIENKYNEYLHYAYIFNNIESHEIDNPTRTVNIQTLYYTSFKISSSTDKLYFMFKVENTGDKDKSVNKTLETFKIFTEYSKFSEFKNLGMKLLFNNLTTDLVIYFALKDTDINENIFNTLGQYVKNILLNYEGLNMVCYLSNTSENSFNSKYLSNFFQNLTKYPTDNFQITTNFINSEKTKYYLNSKKGFENI
jgi:hypothetical protein